MLRPAATARRVSPQALSAPVAPRFWGVRRRLTGPCMMAVSPGSEDGDAAAGDGGDGGAEEGGADAGAGGERKEGASAEDASTEAEVDIDMADDEKEEDLAPLSLLAQGDSLPLSYRSDNGTRESEFFVGDENEHINPYYDVVRRLSPTELIGRFMRTSSPKVIHAYIYKMLLTAVAVLYEYRREEMPYVQTKQSIAVSRIDFYIFIRNYTRCQTAVGNRTAISCLQKPFSPLHLPCVAQKNVCTPQDPVLQTFLRWYAGSA